MELEVKKTIEKLTGFHKPSMRALIEAVHRDQGLLPQFYWPLDLLGAEMATCDAWGVVVEDRVLAFVLYRDLPAAWEISLVVTHPDFRRQNLMAELLRNIINAPSRDKELWLEVHEENTAAQKLYEKLGFKETGRRPRYYKDGATAILYRRS
ncbi:MAG: GNAT family N-acetyltransferase [Bdellovibrio sp.]